MMRETGGPGQGDGVRGCRPFSAENCPPGSFPGAPKSGAAARSPLKTAHWAVFRALRTLRPTMELSESGTARWQTGGLFFLSARTEELSPCLT